MAVPLAAASDDLSGGGVQGGEEGGGAVADVVMGETLDIAQSQRQRPLGAVQCLDLTLTACHAYPPWQAGSAWACP